MTRTQRILAVALSGALLLGGFAIGRVTDVPKTSAEENQLASNRTTPTSNQLAGESQSFNTSDYKAGYSDGYNSCLSNAATNASANYNGLGYNDGYRTGYAEAYRERTGQQMPMMSPFAPVRTGAAPVRMSYRPVVYRTSERRHSSKLKTALRIAAPAAIGAGIGLAAGGKKGAGVGALIGGGGGALYHLFKDR